MPLERVQFLQQCYPLPFLLDRGLQSGVPAMTRRRMPPTSSSAKHLRNLGAKANLSSFFLSSSPLLFFVLFLFLFTSPAPSSLSFLLSLSFHLPFSTGPQASYMHALFLPSYFEVSDQ